jgi:propionyl-CoA carboxylase alpha chain/3-methylcrotonyl-CoA carboxylase alpha subunit
MFKSVLVANRGEIACRVFRTARRMGIRTIAVYSEADARALHVREADEAVLIGPAPARESYLDAAKVLAAAKQTGAEAVHPGYGFLSENADFAEAVMAAGLVWIGPPPAAIRAMGLKDAAKKLMIEAGVPVTPGYQGENQDAAYLAEQAAGIGYPVLIKAVAGGGGKGMRKVDRAEDFADALASAQREGQSSFGDPRVLIESYITRPRHIEVQIFGDSHGTVVHLHERDCSLQRRHQKVIEEAPAPGMDQATRDAVTAAAVRAALAVNYEGAGTIEFIADASDGLKADRIWFMEMNTRLQVEHPVTEAITGVDLVEWQFRVAAGEPIPLKQADIPLNGWAMEARLYAEDPANGFLPSIGKLEHFVLPDDVRIDTGVYEGGEVSQFYDPMIAKLIVHAETREEAAGRLAVAASEVEVWPVKTNAAFVMKCLDHPRFISGDVDTGFIANEETALVADPLSDMGREDAAFRLREVTATDDDAVTSPWNNLEGVVGFRANAPARSTQFVVIDGTPGNVRMLEQDDHPITSLIPMSSTRVVAFENGSAFEVRSFPRPGASGGTASDGSLRAPMPGKIVATPAKAGDTVTKGQPVIVLEAMKMEHALVAPFDGVVGAINANVGDQVGADAVLATVEASAG